MSTLPPPSREESRSGPRPAITLLRGPVALPPPPRTQPQAPEPRDRQAWAPWTGGGCRTPTARGSLPPQAPAVICPRPPPRPCSPSPVLPQRSSAGLPPGLPSSGPSHTGLWEIRTAVPSLGPPAAWNVLLHIHRPADARFSRLSSGLSSIQDPFPDIDLDPPAPRTVTRTVGAPLYTPH